MIDGDDMKAIFEKEYNYISEAKYFLMLHYANEDFSTMRDRLKAKSGYNETLKQVLSDLECMHKEVEEACGELSNSYAIYFKSYFEEGNVATCLADCMLLQGECTTGIAPHKLADYIKKSFHVSNKFFVQCVLDPEETEKLQDMSQDEFFHEVDRLSYCDEVKWNIWRVFCNFDEHVDRLMEVVLPLISVIKQIYKRYEVVFQPFVTYWEEACTDGTFFDKLKKAYPIELKEHDSEGELHVVLSCMPGNMLRLIGCAEDDSEMYMFVGIMFKEFALLSKSESFTKEDICDRLKLLSDTSKYEILKLTKNKKLYGAQLAEQLKLTTATISHHVSALTNVGLLTIEKDSNRVYYQLNSEQVGYIMDQLRKDLYED